MSRIHFKTQYQGLIYTDYHVDNPYHLVLIMNISHRNMPLEVSSVYCTTHRLRGTMFLIDVVILRGNCVTIQRSLKLNDNEMIYFIYFFYVGFSGSLYCSASKLHVRLVILKYQSGCWC